jgi:hypothetical protein
LICFTVIIYLCIVDINLYLFFLTVKALSLYKRYAFEFIKKIYTLFSLWLCTNRQIRNQPEEKQYMTRAQLWNIRRRHGDIRTSMLTVINDAFGIQ